MVFNLKKISQILLVSALIGSQIILLSAYEAHVINVTARICSYAETRTIGFWKTHLDVILEEELLPQDMGHSPEDEKILVPRFQEIFENANADVMVDMLRAQLLGMKFNVDYFPGTGNFEYDSMTIFDIIDLADEALREPSSPREYLEYLKNLLDYLNDQHKLTHCSESDKFN